jgi:hypothetical protein
MARLRDLDGQFLKNCKDDGSKFRTDDGVLAPDVQGVLFMCPLCRRHYVQVWFEGRGVPASATPTPRWRATGTSLDDLTLSPSINLDVPQARAAGGCLWHGFVTNGEAA